MPRKHEKHRVGGWKVRQGCLSDVAIIGLWADLHVLSHQPELILLEAGSKVLDNVGVQGHVFQQGDLFEELGLCLLVWIEHLLDGYRLHP